MTPHLNHLAKCDAASDLVFRSKIPDPRTGHEVGTFIPQKHF